MRPIYIFYILLILLLSNLVSSTDFGYDSSVLPILQPEETTTTNIIEGANYSINVNQSDYWG